MTVASARQLSLVSGRESAVVEGTATISLADALACYDRWPAPTVIVVDGPYGVGGFPGDPPTPDELAGWYEPHAAAWARCSLPETTLWLWSSEVGFAEIHPVLKRHGWRYAGASIWDKGIGQVAGNVNSRTIRGFPIVSEVCVRYVRIVRLPTVSGELLPLKEWLRAEWLRSGLPLARTNHACGVANAATRKYFTLDWRWYFPPAGMMERLAAYAEEHGEPTEIPYFSIDRETPLTGTAWDRMRAKWNHAHGITNVWREPSLRDSERYRCHGSLKTAHLNQKPLKLIERIICASSNEGDVIWEPFGGLCTAAIAGRRLGRRAYAAEINPEFYELAIDRLERENALHGNA